MVAKHRRVRGRGQQTAAQIIQIGGLPTRQACDMLVNGSFRDFFVYLERRRSMTAQVFVVTACSRLPLVC
jgi:hypothetical protein